MTLPVNENNFYLFIRGLGLKVTIGNKVNYRIVEANHYLFQFFIRK
jgi:hypothetical protein